MEKKYPKLLSKLERELENFVEMQPLELMCTEVTAVRTALGKLQSMVLETVFAPKSEEVLFFKDVKPRFYSLLVLAAERYGFEMARPLRRGKGMDAFYGRQLDYISRFFNQHVFLYQYYRVNATELDGLYVIRSVIILDCLELTCPLLIQPFRHWAIIFFKVPCP